MVPLGAEILTKRVGNDGRGAVRRILRLGVRAHVSGDIAVALILNLSETGLLVETVVDLKVGESLHVDLPETNASIARVVWTDGLRAGCEFLKPLSSAAISAARLRDPGHAQNLAGQSPRFAANRDGDEATIYRTIVLISALIAMVALIVFLAAILPFG